MTNTFSNLYHGNLPEKGKKLLQHLEEKVEIKTLDLENEDMDFSNAVILLSGAEESENINFKQYIKKAYEAHCPILLFAPAPKAISYLYSILGKKNFQGGTNDSEEAALFGVKLGRDQIHYSVHEYKDGIDAWANSIVEFADESHILEQNERRRLLVDAGNALKNDGEVVNLLELAQKHVATYRFRVGIPLKHVIGKFNRENITPYESGDEEDNTKKDCSLSFFIVSCHIFEKNNPNNKQKTLDKVGEDWYYVRQTGILNGFNNYVKRWVDGTTTVCADQGRQVKCWVNGGRVCLNYINRYEMENNIIASKNGEKLSGIDLIETAPEALNGITTYNYNKSINIGGTVGFEGGKSGGNTTLGQASLTAGATFSSGYSFSVQDCSCQNYSLNKHTSGAKWVYTFKRAAWNGRDLHDPAQLACSVFSPVNAWIWKVPTSLRGKYTGFQSIFKIYIIHTTTRNTGSISPSHHEYYNEETCKFEKIIPLAYPPLLCADKHSLMFVGDAEEPKKIEIAAQGFVKVSTSREWLDTYLMHAEESVKELYIQADQFYKEDTRFGFRDGVVTVEMFRTEEDVKDPNKEAVETLKIDIVQSASKKPIPIK